MSHRTPRIPAKKTHRAPLWTTPFLLIACAQAQDLDTNRTAPGGSPAGGTGAQPGSGAQTGTAQHSPRAALEARAAAPTVVHRAAAEPTRAAVRWAVVAPAWAGVAE